MKTKGKCRCGRRQRGKHNWMRRRAEDGVWVGFDTGDFCPHCGDYLDKNGCAYEMVRKDRVVAWIQTYATPDIAGAVTEDFGLTFADPADEGCDDA